jgi:hypothetical protein
VTVAESEVVFVIESSRRRPADQWPGPDTAYWTHSDCAGIRPDRTASWRG